MARIRCIVGYTTEKETEPGVFVEAPIERSYSGDVLRNVLNQDSVGVINNINVSHRFSIVCDPYATENVSTMRYVLWKGTRWKITGVEFLRPRLILTVGGTYNGSTS
jgi:hypothetical protein